MVKPSLNIVDQFFYTSRASPCFLTLQADSTHSSNENSDAYQDIVVPVSANYSMLTPAFLSTLLDISLLDPPCVVLAIVDGDGTVVLNRLHRGVHAPVEGFTGTDTLGTGKRARGPERQHKQAKH